VAREPRTDKSAADMARRADVARWFEAGVELMRRREFFAAHEELELAWRAAERDERDFFQGLVHVTVAWYQAGRGNEPGCRRQLEKAARRLAPYTPAHRGLDVAAILSQVEHARSLVARGSLALPKLQF
jgi:predicted metal-dependent hydrolase